MVGKLTFGKWNPADANAAAFRALVANDDIWEMQRTDDANREKTLKQDFPGAWLAVWRDFSTPVGFAIYIPIQIGIYEQHVGFIEQWRGDFAVIGLKKATERMFIQTDAAQIIAECPNYNLAVRLIAKNCGARELFYIERFVTRDGIPYGATVCGKTLEEWVWDNHQEFNDGPLLLFPDSDEWDQTHRNMTILALEMAKSGQATKGQFIYNRWLGLSKFNERSVANNIPHGKLSGTNEPPQNKQLSGVPGQSKTGAEILPSLCQSQNAGVAQTESPDAGTAQETERAQVCAGLSPAGQDQTKAVSSKGLQWVAPDASSGLQHAVESCVALPQTPPRAPSSGVIDPMRVLWHSQDSVVLDIAGHRLWIINGAITKALKQPCQ